MGMINLDGRTDPDNPVYASTFSIPLPIETFALGYYVMVKTGDRADITYDRASDAIAIDWPAHYAENLTARAQSVFDKVVLANGVDYRDDLFEARVFAPNTVLYVNDASLIPGYLGCNPFMSITALAERNVEGVLQDRR